MEADDKPLFPVEIALKQSKQISTQLIGKLKTIQERPILAPPLKPKLSLGFLQLENRHFSSKKFTVITFSGKKFVD